MARLSAALEDFRYWFASPRSRRTRYAGAGIGLVLAALLALFAWQALSARSALGSAADDAQVLQQQIANGDVEGAQRTLSHLQDVTEKAHRSTDGPLWSVGAKLPWLGRNVDAVSTVSEELDRVADEALPAIVELAGTLNSRTFNPTDGRVDLAAIRRVAPDIADMAASLDTSRTSLEDVDADSLLVPLRGPVSTVKSKIVTAAKVADNAELASELLPEMLGGDDTRRYLLLFQNNAESRPTGGIAGSYSVITARRGKVTLGTQGSIQDMPPLTEGVVKLADDEKAVFPSTMATDLRDVNTTPHFPRSAGIAKKLFEKAYDEKVDGVVSIDPVAVSYLLEGLGATRINKYVTLDQSNAVDLLLHQTYVLATDTDVQDDFFELVTKKIFNQFAAGAGDPPTTLRGLVRGVSENRITVWSSHDDEQELIAPTDLSGAIPDDDGDHPRIGLYLSDAASTKMEYFLSSTTTLRSFRCEPDRQELRLSAELTSRAPTGLPRSVTGEGDFVKRGNMRLNVRLFSPTGGSFTEVRVDGQPATIYADRWRDRNVTRLDITLEPGQSKIITASVMSGRGQRGSAIFSTTPGVESIRNDFSIPSACGS